MFLFSAYFRTISALTSSTLVLSIFSRLFLVSISKATFVFMILRFCFSTVSKRLYRIVKSSYRTSLGFIVKGALAALYSATKFFKLLNPANPFAVYPKKVFGAPVLGRIIPELALSSIAAVCGRPNYICKPLLVWPPFEK